MPHLNLVLTCAHCTSPFHAHRASQRFCSKSCASRARATTPTTCAADGCTRTARSGGYCEPHYRRARRALGDPRGWKGNPIGRFWRMVETGPQCWNWRASTDGKGYGQFKVDGRGVQAHRFAYELMVEPIPEGLVLDHLCLNKRCVKPSHLEPVTFAENVRRGIAVSAKRGTAS